MSADPHDKPARVIPVGPRRQIVGPPENEVDISGKGSDEIAVVALDHVLRVGQQVVALKGGLKLEFDHLNERLDSIERNAATPPAVPPMRDPESSYHDFDPAVRTLRAVLRERVRDERDPLGEVHARELVERVVVDMRRDSDAAKWQGLKTGAGKVAWEVFKWGLPLLAAAAGGAAVHFWHVLHP